MLRPTFLGFDIARRGMTAAQKGIDIAGQNLVNWDSEGYTRQRMDQVAVAPNSYASRFAGNKANVAGQGVDITGVSQLRDSFLDKRFREEYGDEGYYNQAEMILSDIESALDEFQPNSDSGLRGALSGISKALQNFSANPYSETHANIVATEFKNITATVHQLYSKLNNVAEQQKYDLEVSVADVNKKLEQVAQLNQTIRDDLGVVGNNNYGPNELLDQRNLLLDQLSKCTDLNVIRENDGTVTVEMNGKQVVHDCNQFETIEMSTDQSDGIVSLRWASSGKKLDMTKGTLKAYTDFINGRGPNVVKAGETSLRGVLYYKDKLDTFSSTMVDLANHAIPDTIDKDGKITYKKLMGAMNDTPDPKTGKYTVDPNGFVTAENFSVSDQWSTNPSYVIYKELDADGKPADTQNNKYILGFSAALFEGSTTFLSNGEKFEGTFLDYVKSYATTLGEDISFHAGRNTATTSICDQLQDRRDEVSGVVVDEETANVMLYQKSLQAASRLMTALDEALDVLINRTGRVGL